MKCTKNIEERNVQMVNQNQKTTGLYEPEFEHDNCGIGAVVNIKGIKTHDTVENALKIVENLEHRAGKDAEGKTGDGVGILLQISHKFFKKVADELGIELGEEREYGVGMFFFPQDELKRNQAKKMFETILEKEGLKFLGWREVPIKPGVLGLKALEKCLISSRYLLKSLRTLPRGLSLTVSSMLQEECLNSLMKIHMLFHVQAELLFTKACFL